MNVLWCYWHQPPCAAEEGGEKLLKCFSAAPLFKPLPVHRAATSTRSETFWLSGLQRSLEWTEQAKKLHGAPFIGFCWHFDKYFTFSSAQTLCVKGWRILPCCQSRVFGGNALGWRNRISSRYWMQWCERKLLWWQRLSTTEVFAPGQTRNTTCAHCSLHYKLSSVTKTCKYAMFSTEMGHFDSGTFLDA